MTPIIILTPKMNFKFKSNFNTRRLTSALWSVYKFLNSLFRVTFAIKCLTSIVIHCIYLNHVQSLKRETDFETQQNIIAKIKYFEKLLYSFGCIYRSLGPLGLFCESIFFISDVISCIMLFTNQRTFNYVAGNNFINFLIDPEAESSRLSKNIEIYLKQIVDSNINYTRLLVDKKQENTRATTGMLPSSLSYLNVSYYDKGSTTNNTATAKIIRKTLTSKTKDRNNSGCSFPKKKLVDSLLEQFKHLSILRSSKRNIWPPNRNSFWAKKIKYLWLQIHIFFTITIIVIAWFLVHLSFSIVSQSFKSFKGNYDPNFTKINFLDKLSIVEINLYLVIVVDWFVTPLTVTIVCVRDQLEYLNSLEPKILKIYEKIENLCNMDGRNNTRDELSLETKIEFTSTINLKQKQENLKIQCDKEAIELYLIYRLSRDEIKSSMQLAHRAIGQSVAFAILSLVLPLVYFESLPERHYYFMFLVGLAFTVTINFTLCLCASLHASYRRVTNLIWSLIAFAESHLSSKHAKVDLFQKDSEDDKISSTGYRACCQSFTKDQSLTNVDFGYYTNSSITLHTMFLWRRLVENYDVFIESSSGKLYGFIMIDYNGILRFNFWLVSIIIISLTYKE